MAEMCTCNIFSQLLDTFRKGINLISVLEKKKIRSESERRMDALWKF